MQIRYRPRRTGERRNLDPGAISRLLVTCAAIDERRICDWSVSHLLGTFTCLLYRKPSDEWFPEIGQCIPRGSQSLNIQIYKYTPRFRFRPLQYVARLPHCRLFVAPAGIRCPVCRTDSDMMRPLCTQGTPLPGASLARHSADQESRQWYPPSGKFRIIRQAHKREKWIGVVCSHLLSWEHIAE